MCDIKMCIVFEINHYKSLVYLVAFCKLNLFNLDSAPTRPDKPTEIDINDNKKERVIKIIIGSAVSCMTALIIFIFTILHFRRRSNRMQQVIKDEVIPLR